MAKSYLITGGSGFIGAAWVRRLLSDGHRVRILDNMSRGHMRRLKGVSDDVEVIEADIRDADAVTQAADGMDSVCHAAFVNGTEFFYTKPELVLDVGVRGMINVLDACIAKNVGELVLASSSEVYQTPPHIPTDETVPLSIPDPMNPRYSYGAGKIISEIMAINYARKHFERLLIFRPHNVYGPDMGWEHVVPQFILRMNKQIAESGKSDVPMPFAIQGSGRETRAFIFIDDFIDGLMCVLDRGQHMQIYHIGTMDEITIADAAHTVAGYFDQSIELQPGKSPEGGTNRRCPDITKLKTLGFEPKCSFAAGVEATARWYVENAHLAPTSS